MRALFVIDCPVLCCGNSVFERAKLLDFAAMDKRITRYPSLEAMKTAELRHWQSLPPRERIQAVSDISITAYALKGKFPDVPRLQRTLVRLQRARR